MGETAGILALIATTLSSLASVGVMVGLLLQGRQLRISQLQAVKATQAELIRMAVDRPDLYASQGDEFAPNPEVMRRWVYLNWRVNHFEFAYLLKNLSEEGLRLQMANMFAVVERREWWAVVRESYQVEAKAGRKRKFFAIVDSEYQRVCEKVAFNETALGCATPG